jgi:hypothetical protein
MAGQIARVTDRDPGTSQVEANLTGMRMRENARGCEVHHFVAVLNRIETATGRSNVQSKLPVEVADKMLETKDIGETTVESRPGGRAEDLTQRQFNRQSKLHGCFHNSQIAVQ